MNPELRKRILFLLSVLLVCVCTFLLFRPLSYTPPAEPSPAQPITFDEFYEQKKEVSRQKGVRPGNEERLVRYGDRTPVAFLYIHGFGASRAEGEGALDPVAEKLKANTYYLRLPGHGTTPEDQVTATFSDYLDASEEAYRMTRLLGDRVIVVGTSMGGLLATYLASRHPEMAGLILASPFYDYENPFGRLANEPGGILLLEILNGSRFRDASRKPDDPIDARLPGYEGYWYVKPYLASLRSLEDLREYAARQGTYERVTPPVLMLYFYKSEQMRDRLVSVPSMLEAFHQFGTSSRPNPLNRAFAVEGGGHVLLSRWAAIPCERCGREMLQFAKDVTSTVNPPGSQRSY